jgi:hypothetical protein
MPYAGTAATQATIFLNYNCLNVLEKILEERKCLQKHFTKVSIFF